MFYAHQLCAFGSRRRRRQLRQQRLHLLEAGVVLAVNIFDPRRHRGRSLAERANLGVQRRVALRQLVRDFRHIPRGFVQLVRGQVPLPRVEQAQHVEPVAVRVPNAQASFSAHAQRVVGPHLARGIRQTDCAGVVACDFGAVPAKKQKEKPRVSARLHHRHTYTQRPRPARTAPHRIVVGVTSHQRWCSSGVIGWIPSNSLHQQTQKHARKHASTQARKHASTHTPDRKAEAPRVGVLGATHHRREARLRVVAEAGDHRGVVADSVVVRAADHDGREAVGLVGLPAEDDGKTVVRRIDGVGPN